MGWDDFSHRGVTPGGWDWDTFDHHPPCPRGCGELADECACPPARRNPLGSMKISGGGEVLPCIECGQRHGQGCPLYADDDYRPRCRWHGCRKEGLNQGYCDVHFGTL